MEHISFVTCDRIEKYHPAASQNHTTCAQTVENPYQTIGQSSDETFRNAPYERQFDTIASDFKCHTRGETTLSTVPFFKHVSTEYDKRP